MDQRSHTGTAREVAAAFAKGSVLFGGEDGRNYMVHASHRDGRGHGGSARRSTPTSSTSSMASATFVTGGTVENAKPDCAW